MIIIHKKNYDYWYNKIPYIVNIQTDYAFLIGTTNQLRTDVPHIYVEFAELNFQFSFGKHLSCLWWLYYFDIEKYEYDWRNQNNNFTMNIYFYRTVLFKIAGKMSIGKNIEVKFCETEVLPWNYFHFCMFRKRIFFCRIIGTEILFYFQNNQEKQCNSSLSSFPLLYSLYVTIF